MARAPALHAGGQRFESVILHPGKKVAAVKSASYRVVKMYASTDNQPDNETTRQQDNIFQKIFDILTQDKTVDK